MKRVVAYVDILLSRFLIFLMAILVLTVTWQVVTRYVLSAPSSYTEELATYLLIWISMLGAVHALKERAHLGIDVLTRRLKGGAKQVSHTVTYLSVIVFALLVMVFGGGWLVYVTLTLNQVSAAFQIPVGYVYSILPLSGILLAVYATSFMMEQAGDEGRTITSVD